MNGFYEFENFRADVEKRLLWKDEEIVSIKPKTFDTLLALLRNKNETISKDDLIEEIWNGDAVSDDSVTQQISQLRKILGETADEHKFIVTVSGVGYKFVAEVNYFDQNGRETVWADLSENDSQINRGNTLESEDQFYNPAKQAQQNTQIARSPNPAFLLAFVGLIVLVGFAFYFFRQPDSDNFPKNTLEVRKIAVLPFKIIPNDEKMNGLKAGLNSDLINRLSKFEKLNILSNAAIADYEKSGGDSIGFGKRLDVEAVLDGTIKKQGDSISITAQLIRVSDGKVLWSEIFTDKFIELIETQRLFAYKISEVLSLELVESEERAKMKRSTTSPEAYRLYLDARYLIYSRKGGEARELAKKNLNTAIQLDPKFALAYALLADMEADAPTQESYQRMKVFSKKAIDLDENLKEARVLYAMAIWRGDWNWAEAEKQLAIANRLDAKDWGANSLKTLVLIGQGKFNEAHEYILSKPVKYAAPMPDEIAVYYYERNYDKAIELSLDRDKQMPGDADALSYLALSYIGKNAKDKGIEYAEEYAAFDELVGVGGLVYLGYARAKFGQKAEAREIIRQIISKNPPPTAQIHGGLAMIYGELGEKNAAFEYLEKSIENREWWAFTLKVAPYYDSLRDDRRFGEMLAKVNLTD